MSFIKKKEREIIEKTIITDDGDENTYPNNSSFIFCSFQNAFIFVVYNMNA